MLVSSTAIFWIYLKINSFMTIIQLRVILALFISCCLGMLAALFVKKFKIRNPLIATFSVMLALLIGSYLKWAFYVADDFKEIYYDDMKTSTASEYYYNDIDDICTTREFIDTLKQTSASELFTYETSDYQSYMTAEERLSLQNDSLWDYLNLDEILGTDEVEVAKSLAKAKKINAYEFTFDYREMDEMTVGYLVSHPTQFFKAIGDINEIGRWTTSSSSYKDDYSSNTKGVFLAIVWIFEALALCLPAMIWVHFKASEPFIEHENSWATEQDIKGYMRFYETIYDYKTDKGRNLKNHLLENPSAFFSLEPIKIGAQAPEVYYSVDHFYHSSDYSESYITVFTHILKKVKTQYKYECSSLVKNLAVNADFIAQLYKQFGMQPPAGCGIQGQYVNANVNTPPQSVPQPADSYTSQMLEKEKSTLK